MVVEACNMRIARIYVELYRVYLCFTIGLATCFLYNYGDHLKNIDYIYGKYKRIANRYNLKPL